MALIFDSPLHGFANNTIAVAMTRPTHVRGKAKRQGGTEDVALVNYEINTDGLLPVTTPPKYHFSHPLDLVAGTYTLWHQVYDTDGLEWKKDWEITFNGPEAIEDVPPPPPASRVYHLTANLKAPPLRDGAMVPKHKVEKKLEKLTPDVTRKELTLAFSFAVTAEAKTTKMLASVNAMFFPASGGKPTIVSVSNNVVTLDQALAGTFALDKLVFPNEKGEVHYRVYFWDPTKAKDAKDVRELVTQEKYKIDVK